MEWPSGPYGNRARGSGHSRPTTPRAGGGLASIDDDHPAPRIVGRVIEGGVHTAPHRDRSAVAIVVNSVLAHWRIEVRLNIFDRELLRLHDRSRALHASNEAAEPALHEDLVGPALHEGIGDHGDAHRVFARGRLLHHANADLVGGQLAPHLPAVALRRTRPNLGVHDHDDAHHSLGDFKCVLGALAQDLPLLLSTYDPPARVLDQLLQLRLRIRLLLLWVPLTLQHQVLGQTRQFLARIDRLRGNPPVVLDFLARLERLEHSIALAAAKALCRRTLWDVPIFQVRHCALAAHWRIRS
mmetsp:Transcript_23961/g.53961  ORF Transcript_23961/g.53961 Transcript_23961/m.53961 type:complete len:298 (+) Transcript_23961:41-934(+)